MKTNNRSGLKSEQKQFSENLRANECDIEVRSENTQLN